MNRTKLSKIMRSHVLNLPRKMADQFIGFFLSELAQAADEGRVTTLYGFGKFFPRTRKAYTCYNAYKGERVNLPQRRLLGFKRSQHLTHFINGKTKSGYRKMTSKHLVKRLSKSTGIPFKISHVLLNVMIDYMTEILFQEGRLHINKIGVLKIRHRPQQKGRHIVTGELFDSPPCKVIYFSRSTTLNLKALAS